MPEEPLINLLIAVGYLSHVTSRRCTDRHKVSLPINPHPQPSRPSSLAP
jgi:hypothetical protein